MVESNIDDTEAIYVSEIPFAEIMEGFHVLMDNAKLHDIEISHYCVTRNILANLKVTVAESPAYIAVDGLCGVPSFMGFPIYACLDSFPCISAVPVFEDLWKRARLWGHFEIADGVWRFVT